MSELRRALAYVLRRQGRDAMAAEELRNVLSFDLRWFSPAEARTFLELARERGLLEGDDAALHPTFDPDEVEVPVPYKPDAGILEEPAPQALVDEVVEAVADATGREPDRLERDVRRERERLGGLVTDEVAALLVAEARGVDTSRWVPSARRRLDEELDGARGDAGRDGGDAADADDASDASGAGS